MTSSASPRSARPGPVNGPGNGPGEEALPVLLPWAVLALTLAMVLRSLDALLGQVQIADAVSGGMESLASGLGLGVIDDTRALLQTWYDSTSAHRLVLWTARAYTGVDVVYSLVLATLDRKSTR